MARSLNILFVDRLPIIMEDIVSKNPNFLVRTAGSRGGNYAIFRCGINLLLERRSALYFIAISTECLVQNRSESTTAALVQPSSKHFSRSKNSLRHVLRQFQPLFCLWDKAIERSGFAWILPSFVGNGAEATSTTTRTSEQTKIKGSVSPMGVIMAFSYYAERPILSSPLKRAQRASTPGHRAVTFPWSFSLAIQRESDVKRAKREWSAVGITPLILRAR